MTTILTRSAELTRKRAEVARSNGRQMRRLWWWTLFVRLGLLRSRSYEISYRHIEVRRDGMITSRPASMWGVDEADARATCLWLLKREQYDYPGTSHWAFTIRRDKP